MAPSPAARTVHAERAPGPDRRLAWSEVMPVVVVGVLALAAAGVVAPLAVAPALDLAAVTGAVTRLPLQPRPLAVVLAAAAVLALSALALLRPPLPQPRSTLR